MLFLCACDSVQLETEGHQALFTIKIRHGVTPKLYNTGSDTDQGKQYSTLMYNTAIMLTLCIS